MKVCDVLFVDGLYGLQMGAGYNDALLVEPSMQIREQQLRKPNGKAWV